MANQHSEKPVLTKAWRDDINRALEVLNSGGLILYPTDTIWGIGCDATNPAAVERVFALKQRSDSKALISLVDSDAKVQFYVRDVPAVAWDVIDYATRPLTIIYDGARNLAPNLLAADGSAALRITQEPFSHELCFRFRRAIVSTSANVSGEPAPQCFDDIADEIKNGVDYVCTSRRNEHGPAKASSILKIGTGGIVDIIRR